MLRPNPPIPSSCCKHFVFLRPNIFFTSQESYPRVPPCNDLTNLIFKIYEVITSYILRGRESGKFVLYFVKYFQNL